MRNIIKNILLTEGRIDDAKSKYPHLGDDIIDYASQKDPSGNNKYLNWILGHHISHQKLLDDYHVGYDYNEYVKRSNNKTDEIVGVLEEFEKFNNRLTGNRVYEAFVNVLGSIPQNVTLVRGEEGDPSVWQPNNINTYYSVAVLKDILNYILTNYPSKSEIKKETIKLYEDGCLLVVVPKTVRSSCKYGSGTKWCTTSTSGRMFNKYTSGDQGLIYYVFKKPFESHGTRNQKMALHWETYRGNKLKYKWFEAGDSPINGPNFLSKYLSQCYSEIGDPDIPGVDGIPGYITSKGKMKEINKIVVRYIKTREGQEISNGLLGWLKKIFS